MSGRECFFLKRILEYNKFHHLLCILIADHGKINV